MLSRIITIEEGVKVLSNLGRERIGSNALELCRVQLQTILMSFGSKNEEREANLGIVARSLRRLGEWLRGVNKKGEFNLPLRALEMEIFAMVSSASEGELDLSSLESAVSGYRPRHTSKSTTHVFIRRRPQKSHQVTQPAAAQSFPLQSGQADASRTRQASC